MVVPGQKLPSGEALPSNTAVIASPTRSAPGAVASPQTSTSSHGLSGGAIAGIVVGGIIGLAILGALLFCLGRHRTELEFLRRDIHIQKRQATSPEMRRTEFESVPPRSPSFPDNPNDPRIGKYNPYDVPPYVPPYVERRTLSPEPRAVELDVPGVVISKPPSPSSGGRKLSRDTASPPPFGLMETLAPEYGQTKSRPREN